MPTDRDQRPREVAPEMYQLLKDVVESRFFRHPDDEPITCDSLRGEYEQLCRQIDYFSDKLGFGDDD